jgi:hypothetical protein
MRSAIFMHPSSWLISSLTAFIEQLGFWSDSIAGLGCDDITWIFLICLSCMTDTADLQESIYQEMRSKIKEDETQAPQRKGPFFYYSKNLKGEQYVVHCRRMAPGGEGPGHVHEVMETGSGAPEEEVLLDENKAGKEYEFYHVGEVKVNLFWVALNLLFIIFIFLRCLWGK